MAGRLVVMMRRSISTSATKLLPPLVGAQYTRFLPCGTGTDGWQQQDCDTTCEEGMAGGGKECRGARSASSSSPEAQAFSHGTHVEHAPGGQALCLPVVQAAGDAAGPAERDCQVIRQVGFCKKNHKARKHELCVHVGQ